VLAERPHATVTLLDLTPEMIDAARARIGDQRAIYRVGDFRQVDLGGDYDLIIASLSLHHLTHDERSAFAARLFESLAPGGQLLTAEVIVDPSPDVRERQYSLWRDFMRSHGEDGDEWYRKHLLKDHPVEPRAWIDWLTSAGFRSAGCYWRYLNFAVFAAERPAQ
jgi:tRNA (cmo5U34)-methyltransferase